MINKKNQDAYEWGRLLRYCTQQGLDIEQLTRLDLQGYIAQELARGMNKKYLNGRLVRLERSWDQHYPTRYNPASGYRLRGRTPKAIDIPLELEVLEGFLWGLPKGSFHERRRYLLASLVHYQALQLGEILNLECKDIDLSKGQLWIKSYRRSDARSLSLQTDQVAQLKTFLERKNQTSLMGLKSLAYEQKQLIRQAQKRGVELRSLAHWRSSIIVDRLQKRPLLVVQKELGHRWASTTERYQMDSVRSLQEALLRYHPLQ